MLTLHVRDDLELAARQLKYYARAYRPYDGIKEPPYRLLHLESASGLVISAMYTRDAGHHTSGWFKNPDYERCWHLSMGFYHYYPLRAGLDNCAFEEPVARVLIEKVFGNWQRFIWEEGAKSDVGRRIGVRHYRVFADELWEPIIPKGEVYSTELTEVGWRSWSQQHPTDPNASHQKHENSNK
jgi:hypothetical protein